MMKTTALLLAAVLALGIAGTASATTILLEDTFDTENDGVGSTTSNSTTGPSRTARSI
jgi:hypothetical protein